MTIKINGTNTTAQPSITGTDTDTGLVYGTGEVSVVTDGTERLKVDSSGNVGIGESSPNGTLHVKGASPKIILEGTNGGGTYEHYLGTAGSVAQDFIIQAGSDTTLIRSDNVLFQNTAGSTERLRIQSGGGISFNGDTAAANALDDYEEGTFTPSFINYGSPTISVAQGEYVKIGNSVFLSIRMTWSGGSNSSSSRISGLPFAMIDAHIAVNGWAQKGSAEGSSVYRLATTGTSNTAIYYDPIRSESSGVFYGTIQITSLP
jgi:hypothetical protein